VLRSCNEGATVTPCGSTVSEHFHWVIFRVTVGNFTDVRGEINV
jgi:hypothetical protein